jgi:gamma-glutamyltranspeptidase/glutathione hydrolase
MLSSMTPTIVARDGRPLLVLGSPGGRTIINTVLLTILNVIDHGMGVQQAVDAPRFHHQWLPDEIVYEPFGLSPDTIAALEMRGHRVRERPWPQGAVQAILVNAKDGLLEGAVDPRTPDGAAAGR